jgi:Ni/Co efflux regulator RcnB
MKSFVKAVAAAAVLAAPILSFAQADSSMTRSQVQQDLRQVEAAGYNPGQSDRTTYPNDIQAAESRASRQNGVMQNQNSEYGGVNNGTSVAGMRAMRPMNDGSKPVYFGH